MKTQFLSYVLFFLAIVQLNAQIPAFTRDYKVVNLGVGIGSNLFREAYYSTMIPPVAASFELAVRDHVLEKGVVGIGGYLCAEKYKYSFSRKGWETTSFIIGASGSFHYPLIDHFDTYSGFMLGYEILRNEYFGGYDESDYTGSSNGIKWAWFAGGRYYFRENMAALLELGYGVAYLTFGLAIRL